MPDIQAGDVELTREEARLLKQQNHVEEMETGVYDETGEFHAESKFNHMGRS